MTLHTSSSPFFNALEPPGHSPETLTSAAFGARTRNVTVWSAWTSGEFGGGVNAGRSVDGAWAGAVNCARQTAKLKQRRDRVFIVLFRIGAQLMHQCVAKANPDVAPRDKAAHQGWNDAVQRDGERGRPGCCSTRPRVEPSRRSKPAGVRPRASLPTARAPLPALAISCRNVPLRSGRPTVLRATMETVSTIVRCAATVPGLRQNRRPKITFFVRFSSSAHTIFMKTNGHRH